MNCSTMICLLSQAGWLAIPSCITARVSRDLAWPLFTFSLEVHWRLPLWQYKTALTSTSVTLWKWWTWKILRPIFSTKKLCHFMRRTQHNKTATNVLYFMHGAWIKHVFHYVLSQLDGDAELKEFDSIYQLCLSWDLPAPNATNRKWLSEKLLLHAVLSKCFYLHNLCFWTSPAIR